MFGINDNKDPKKDTPEPESLEAPDTGSVYPHPTAEPPVHHQPLGPPLPPPPHQPALPQIPDDPEPPTEPVTTGDTDKQDLLNIKQEALHNLAPLVDKLDQTPEEKFKTTMMMLQASDNPALVKEAYAAANKIEDEKTRAQALLDVVNEINYFTHPGGA